MPGENTAYVQDIHVNRKTIHCACFELKFCMLKVQKEVAALFNHHTTCNVFQTISVYVDT